MIFLANLVTQCPWHLVNRVRLVADKRRHLAKSRRLRCVREFGRDIPNLSDLNAIKNVLSTPFSLEVSSVRNQLITLSIRITIKMTKNNRVIFMAAFITPKEVQSLAISLLNKTVRTLLRHLLSRRKKIKSK